MPFPSALRVASTVRTIVTVSEPWRRSAGRHSDPDWTGLHVLLRRVRPAVTATAAGSGSSGTVGQCHGEPLPIPSKVFKSLKQSEGLGTVGLAEACWSHAAPAALACLCTDMLYSKARRSETCSTQNCDRLFRPTNSQMNHETAPTPTTARPSPRSPCGIQGRSSPTAPTAAASYSRTQTTHSLTQSLGLSRLISQSRLARAIARASHRAAPSPA